MRTRRGWTRQGGVGLVALGLAGCGPGPWVAVNITSDQATVMRIDETRGAGATSAFTAAVLERTPRLLQGRLADYWTVRTRVDCRAGTYRLGETVAFSFDGRRLALDAGMDPPTTPRPGSIEATETAFACGHPAARLPPVVAGDLPALLRRFRTGVIIR